MNLRLKTPSLALRTALIALSIVVVCMALLGTYASTRLRASMERTTGEQQLSVVSFAASGIDMALAQRAQTLEALAVLVDPGLMADPVALQQFLAIHPGLLNLFSGGAFIANSQGVAMASVPLSVHRLGASFMEQGYMAAVLREGRASVSPPMIGKLVPHRIFAMAAPVRGANGKILGALVGVTDLDKPNFLDMIGAQRYGKTGTFALVSRNPLSVLSSGDKTLPVHQGDWAKTWPGQYGDGREGSGVFVNAAGVELLTSAKNIGLADWFLVAQLPTDEAFGAVRDMRNSLLQATLLFGVLAGVLIWWYLRRQWFPMFSAIGQLARMADASAPLHALPTTGGKELSGLIRGVNRVLQTLEQRETALKNSEAFRRAIFDSVKAEVAVLDRRGIITAVNAPWLQFAQQNAVLLNQGQAPYSSIGVNYLKICEAAAQTDDDDGSAVSAGIRAVLDGRLDSFTFDYPCHSPHEQRWFQTVVTPLNLPDGGVVVSHTNITERVQANLARFDMEERFAHFMQTLPAAAHIKDESGAYVYANPYSQRLLGDAHWLGKTASHYFGAEVAAQCQASDAQALLTGSSVFEEDIPSPDGRVGTYQVNKFKITRAGRPPLLGCISLDITQLKKTQAELTVAKAQADSANNAKSRFLAFASHDLRQPLSALSLFIHVLKARIEPQNREVLAHIEACCASLSNLLTDLLDISKLESGLVHPQLSRFPVKLFLQELGDVYGAVAAQKGLQLRVRMNGFSDLAGQADRGLLTRMVGNFLANAIEHTSAGGVLLALRYRQGRHWIEVWDSGSGMHPKQAQTIADEFSQSSAARSVRGSGLGLSMVAKTAALMGLQVRMCSRAGRGSVFAVELPLGQWQADATVVALHETTLALRIGLVDDHDSARLALALALEAVGHKVIAASNGPELLRQLGGQAPDLVIADNRLHAGETGLQVIEMARGIFGADLPAMVISGDTDPGIEARLRDKGVALLIKPVRWVEMERFLRIVSQRQDT